LVGVVKAYQNGFTAQPPAATDVPADVAPLVVDPPTATSTSSVITLEEAAQLAAQVTGHDNLMSAEVAPFEGQDAYLIKFTNNDEVYVSFDGQILSVQVAPVVVNIAPQNSSVSRGGGEHHEDDDHEEHDD